MKKILLLSFFLSLNGFFAFAQCDYINHDLEDWTTYTFEIGLPNDVDFPDNHFPGGFRFATMLDAYSAPDLVNFWLSDPQGFFGIDRSTDASTGSFALQLQGDPVVPFADIQSEIACDGLQSNITVDLRHVGDVSDTIFFFAAFDENIAPLAFDSLALDSLAGYFIGGIVVDTTTDYFPLIIPIIDNQNGAPVDTFTFWVLAITSPDSYFLLDSVRFNEPTDFDQDGFLSDVDCDDFNPNVNPGATEVCNFIDDNCDGQIDEGLMTFTFYYDGDGDGFGSPDSTYEGCTLITGFVVNNIDCDDANADVYPNAPEVCDGVDNNCDGEVDEGLLATYYLDADMDSYGNPDSTIVDCAGANPAGYVSNGDDCDDADANEFPGQVWYTDADGDGYGTDLIEVACERGLNQFLESELIATDGDCDDSDASINPGAAEICDDIDNDCNGLVDDGLTFLDYYLDSDGDGYGAGDAVNACESPGAEYVTQDGDCDDTNASINPGATEACDGVDNDCNGMVDDGLAFFDYYLDEDGDGFGTGDAINACEAPGANYVIQGGDCDDTNFSINPGATEECDGVDNDCNGMADDGLTFLDYYLDSDGDGYGAGDAINACASPGADYVNQGGDCDDANADVNPGAVEACDSLDNDCNGLVNDGLVFQDYYLDEDADGYGTGDPINDCQAPAGANYATQGGDCDDTNADVNPGAAEACDGLDNDCNGVDDDGLTFLDYFIDEDGDGFGTGDAINACQSPGAEYVNQDGDCDDTNASVYPGAIEQCDNLDNDCNGLVDDDVVTLDYYLDEDGDGYGTGDAITDCLSPGANYVNQGGDCDDTNADVNPGATEACDGKDNDCNGVADDGLVFQDYYLDEDADGYGTGDPINDCQSPGGANYATQGGDCDDTDASINPGATEACDGIDNDCNGTVDDNITFLDYYLDEDGDGYGTGDAITDCQSPGANYVNQGGDCDDTNAEVNPGATEACDGKDNDCNGLADDGLVFQDYYLDEDGDGYGTGDPINDCQVPIGANYATQGGDCDDANADVNPGATEVCNGIDDNCDGETDEGLLSFFYFDGDGDGFGNDTVTIVACGASGEYVANPGDCDDSNAAVFPGADEICDGIDNNCDGQVDEGLAQTDYYLDKDGDGYGAGDAIADCQSPGAGYVTLAGDCDDDNPDVNPAATEICNGIDDNCDGSIDEGVTNTYYADNDGDGFGDANETTEDCSVPMGYVENSEDCDDTNADVNPDATEVCNGIDDNCDGNVDEGTLLTFWLDADGDGYGDVNMATDDCDAPNGYVDNDDDCDDTNAGINPAAEDIPENGIDEDCDGEDAMVNTDELVELDIRVFPNPVSSVIFIENLPANGYKVELFNLIGQNMAIGQSNLPSRIEVAHLTDGLYFVKITEVETGRKKVVMVVKD